MVSTFVIVLPLMLSPGPANLVSLALGARHGVARVLVFQLGIVVVYTIVALAVGLFATEVATHSTFATRVIQLLGGCFVVYLGYRLARRKKRDSDVDTPAFASGVVLQILNPKYPAVVLAVFANRSDLSMVLTAAVVVIVGAAGLLIYSSVGSLVRRLSFSDKGFRILDVGFGALLCIVGLWIARQAFVPA